MRLLTRLFVLLFLAAFAVAQGDKAATPSSSSPTSVPVAAADNDPSKEAAIFESLITKVFYEADGTGTRQTAVVMHVQSQAGVQALAVLSFPYTSSNETVELDYMRVHRPDGTVVVTPDYNIQDMPADVTRNAPMYSDIHEKHVTVKGLGVGDTLEYLVRYRTLKPEVPGHFWFQHTFARIYLVKDEQLEINVPREKYVKVSSPDLQPKTKDDGTRRIYSWKTSNLDLKIREALLKKSEAPKPSVQITTFRSWEEVGRWYRDLQQPEVEVTPQIQAKAAALTKGMTGDGQKIRAIYNYVSTRFHYVSLSFGIGRYRPHPAEDVLENEYGDCKDKHTLLAALLKAAGFEAWPALMNAVSKIDPDVPSPGQFNHVISVVPRGKTMIWLDTTPEVSPFGLILAGLRNKHALVMPADKSAELMTTPAEPPFPSLQTFTTVGKLSADGTLTSHVEQTARGDVEVIYRAAFRNTPQPQWQDLGQRISATSGFGGEVSNVTVSAPDDTEKPFVLSWDYTRKNFGDWGQHQIVMPVPWFGIEGAATEEKKPEEPVRLGAQGGEVTYKAKITLPEGYAPNYSAKEDLTESFADYHATYSIEHGVLTVTRHLTVKTDDVPLDSWETYKKFAKSLSDERDRYIDLTNGRTVYPNGEGPAQAVAMTTGAANNPEAAKLLLEGAQALQNRDLTRAEENFKRVIQIDPKSPGVHASLAWVYCSRGNTEDCYKEWRLEEEYHPDNLDMYQALGKTALATHHNEEALHQFRELLKRDPRNRDAALAIAGILTNDKKDAEAVEVLEKALEHAPDSPTLEVAMGTAYLKVHQSDKAMAIFKKAAAADSTSGMLNEVAYALADANTNLDLAQEYAEKAVHQLEADSVKTQDDDAGLSITQGLSATWDTMGWVFFRKGDFDKARRYLEPSWILTQRSIIGDHLAQTFARLGEKEKAAHQYQLALAAVPNPSDTDHDIREHYKALTGHEMEDSHTHSLRRRGGAAGFTIDDTPVDELSRMRSINLIPKSDQSGSAIFTVIYAPGKVEAANYVSGDKSVQAGAGKITYPKFSVNFPDQGPVWVVRRGILTCGIGGCNFTFLLPNDAFKVPMDIAH